MRKIVPLLWRHFILQLGLFLFALAISGTAQAGLGLSSWDVFHKGLSLHTPLTFGQAGQVTGLVIIGVTILLKEKPGFGTLSNMFFIGFWVDVILNSKLIPTMEQYGFVAQFLLLFVSIALFGLGSGLYIKAAMGSGPRDSLMLALVRRTGWRVFQVRTILELCAISVGWLMGGTVGIGTLLVAVGIGPSVELGFKLCRVQVKKHEKAPKPETALPASR